MALAGRSLGISLFYRVSKDVLVLGYGILYRYPPGGRHGCAVAWLHRPEEDAGRAVEISGVPRKRCIVLVAADGPLAVQRRAGDHLAEPGPAAVSFDILRRGRG